MVLSLFVKIRRLNRRIPSGNAIGACKKKPGIYTTVFTRLFSDTKGGGVVSDKGIHIQRWQGLEA